MDTAALNAKDDGEIDGHPFRLDPRTTIGTPAIPLISFSQQLEELIRALVKSGTILSIISRSRAHCSPSEDAIRVTLTRIVVTPVVQGKTSFASQNRADVFTDRMGFLVSGRSWHVPHVSALDRTLNCVVDRRDPIIHILLGGGLIHSFVLWRDYLKAKSSFCIAGFADRGHAKINRLHVQVEPLLPVAVL